MNETLILDPRLAADCIVVGDLPVTRVLLNEDANYPWLILVPRRGGLIDLIDLEGEDYRKVLGEVADAARVLKDITHCHKLNIASLGNTVAQLHIHVIARQTNDAAWPNPVWGKAPRRVYEREACARLISALRHGLQIPGDRG